MTREAMRGWLRGADERYSLDLEMGDDGALSGQVAVLERHIPEGGSLPWFEVETSGQVYRGQVAERLSGPDEFGFLDFAINLYPYQEQGE